MAMRFTRDVSKLFLKIVLLTVERTLFKGLLSFWIGLGYQWPGLSEPKTKLSEQSLALTNTELNAKLMANKMGEQFAIPLIA